MKTIIQKIGPLYGEAVNGSVFGQQNGSVYVTPNDNVLKLLNTYSSAFIQNYTGYISTRGSGTAPVPVAQYQAIGTAPFSKLRADLATDSGFTNIITTRDYGATRAAVYLQWFNTNGVTIAAGTDYYARLVLVDSAGNDYAISDTYTLTGV